MKIRLTGVAEIDAVLKGLPKEVNNKLLTTAHTNAAKVLVDKAKLLAPEGPTGSLVDSIGTQATGAKNQRALGETNTGPRRGRGKGQRGFAGHLVEYGTSQRKTKKGANRGKMTAKPFMEPAWEQTKGKVEASINDEVGKALVKFMRKTLK
jgi:HK97 gp10 family phage protein